MSATSQFEKISIHPASKQRYPKPQVKRISEQSIENALQSADLKGTKARSTLGIAVDDTLEVYTYTPQIDWKKWNVNTAIDMMMEFSFMTSGIKMRPFQEEFQFRVFESVLLNDGEELTALFSRQSGKTEVIACTADTLMVYIPTLAKLFPEQLGRYAKGFHIGLFAPTDEQACTTHQRMNMRLTSEQADEIILELDIKTKYTGGVLAILGPPTTLASGRIVPAYRSHCKLQSAAKQAKIESKTYDMVIIEEAQDVFTLKVQKSIHPMLASTNGTIVKIGTTTSFTSDFYKAIQRNKRKLIATKIKNHFEFDYKVVQKYAPLYKAYIQKEKERLGEESDAFQMAYALRWLIEKEIALTSYQFEEYMHQPNANYEYASNEQDVYVGGLDLAKKRDSTVLTIAKLTQSGLHGDTLPVKTIVNWLEMKGDNWEDQFNTILEFVYNYNLKVLGVDTTGIGDPIFDRLERVLYDTEIELVPVIYTQPSKHEMATIFYDEMRKKKVQIPGHSDVKKTRRYKNFIEQFTNAQKIYKGSFLSLVKPKDEKNAHDDYVDSLLLLLYAAKQNVTPVVEKTDNIFFGKFNKNSKHSKRYKDAIEKANKKVARWRR